MLAAEDCWGGGGDERPYLPRAFSYPGARGARRRSLGFLLEAIGPGTERLAELRPTGWRWWGRSGSGSARLPSGPTSVGRELRQPLRAGTDRLEQEAERHAVGLHVRPRIRECPRKVRTLVASPTPAVLRGEHVELARPRVPWAGAVVGGYEVVGAEPLDTGDDRHTPLGRRERPRLAQVVRSASTARSKAPPCSS